MILSSHMLAIAIDRVNQEGKILTTDLHKKTLRNKNYNIVNNRKMLPISSFKNSNHIPAWRRRSLSIWQPPDKCVSQWTMARCTVVPLWSRTVRTYLPILIPDPENNLFISSILFFSLASSEDTQYELSERFCV